MPQTEKAECLKMIPGMTCITSKLSFAYKGFIEQKEHSQPTQMVVSGPQTYSFSEEIPCCSHLSTSCVLPESNSLFFRSLQKKAPKNNG